jgi:hypothetical protein
MILSNIGQYIKRIQSCNNDKSIETKLYNDDNSRPAISEYMKKTDSNLSCDGIRSSQNTEGKGNKQ